MVFRRGWQKTWNSGKSGKPLGSWQEGYRRPGCAKIEAAANKPRNWLDIDRSLSQEGFQPVGPSDIGQLAAHNLERWMSESRDLQLRENFTAHPASPR